MGCCYLLLSRTLSTAVICSNAVLSAVGDMATWTPSPGGPRRGPADTKCPGGITEHRGGGGTPAPHRIFIQTHDSDWRGSGNTLHPPPPPSCLPILCHRQPLSPYPFIHFFLLCARATGQNRIPDGRWREIDGGGMGRHELPHARTRAPWIHNQVQPQS
jgi:hypothetical protein